MSAGNGSFYEAMPHIEMYTTRWCGFCVRAKALLESLGLKYEEIPVGDEPGFREKLLTLTGGFTVPQIVVDGRPIGGYQELASLARAGRLVPEPSGDPTPVAYS
jgi:glutaredoxin 3